MALLACSAARAAAAPCHRADMALARAQTARRQKKIRSALRKARGELLEFLRVVRQSKRVGGVLERQLTVNAKAAIAMARPAA